MGFFSFAPRVAVTTQIGSTSLAFLHRMECKACPLNREPNLRNPKMPPFGSDEPLVYMLGEAPGESEDLRGRPFVGKAGRTLRMRIPKSWDDTKLRWNNVIRTRPPKNRTPTPTEIECCRPSIIRDIERTKPIAIFGFGNIPLDWALKETGITRWRGRRVPVKIGNHVCWYFPMLHPSYVMRGRKFAPRNPDEYGSEEEFAFAMDLKRAFRSISSLPTPVVHNREMAMEGLEYVTGERGKADLDRVLDFIDEMYDEAVVGFDLETKGLRPYGKSAKILSVGISGQFKTMAFPLDHKGSKWSAEHRDIVFAAVKRFLLKAPCRKISHNLIFEMEWCAQFFGPKVLYAQKWGDSYGQAYILREQQDKSLNLDFLCMQYFGFHLKALSNIDRKDLDNQPVLAVLSYNGLDAKYHRLLYFAQAERLKHERLLKVYQSHLRRVPAAVLAERQGVPINQDVVEDFYFDFDDRLADIEDELFAMPETKKYKKRTGKAFRPSARADMIFVLENILNIQLDDKKKVDEKALAEIKHPFVTKLLEWREFNKLLSTYVKPYTVGGFKDRFGEKVAPSPHIFDDGLIHPVYNLAKTRTWRSSSEDPNVQNLPKREHREIRRIVKPGGDLKVVSFDFAGIQARNVAMESKDQTLVDSFWDRYDIHADWMHKIAKRYPKWVKEGHKRLGEKDITKYYRGWAKNGLVFPFFFGAQPRKVSMELRIPENIAAALSEEFWDMFGDVKVWHEQVLVDYRKTGYVTGLSGFRRHAPVSINEMINAPIQADESLIVFDAMASLAEYEERRFQPNLEIHDDLTFIWPKHEIERNSEIVVKEMLAVNYDWINVPIGVERSIGDSWDKQEGAGEYWSDQMGFGPER